MTCREFERHIQACAGCRRKVRSIGASELGRKGGSVSSEAKKRAARKRAERQKAKRAKFVADNLGEYESGRWR
mgnify:CR=1 FL=1